MVTDATMRHMTAQPPRALVVDDEMSIVELLQLVLTSDGYEVQTAGTAGEALARVDNGFSPDVVLLDVMLPDMLGFDLVPILRATDGDMPIVFVTARDGPADRLARADGGRRLHREAVLDRRAAGPRQGGSAPRRPPGAPQLRLRRPLPRFFTI